MDAFFANLHAALDNPAAVGGFLAAAAVGIASSFHCFLMCGPLACAGLGGMTRKSKPILAYHLGRTGAYALVGAFLGAVGGTISDALPISLQRFFPWLMAAALVLSAFDLGKWLPAIPGLGRLVGRLGGSAPVRTPWFDRPRSARSRRFSPAGSSTGSTPPPSPPARGSPAYS